MGVFPCISVRKILVKASCFFYWKSSIDSPFLPHTVIPPGWFPPLVPLAKESTRLMFKSPTWDGQIRSKFPIFGAFHKVNLQFLMIEIHEIPNGNHGKIPLEISHFSCFIGLTPPFLGRFPMKSPGSSSDRSFSSALPLATAILCAFTAAAPAAATACEPGRLPPGRATWDQDMDRLGMGLCHVWV